MSVDVNLTVVVCTSVLVICSVDVCKIVDKGKTEEVWNSVEVCGVVEKASDDVIASVVDWGWVEV